MKEIKNQRGFATLEIILAVSIIGILATSAVPKIERLIDKVCLDYEMKHLYSDLNFARSIGKSSNFHGGISAFNDIENGGAVEFWIYSKNYTNSSARNRYQIMRPSVSAYPNYRHNLTNDVKLEISGGEKVRKFAFDNQSHYRDLDKATGNTVKLKVIKPNKMTYEATIVFDSVGRWRGTYNE